MAEEKENLIAIGEKDSEEFWRSAHAIKSCSSNIGATEVLKLAAGAEDLGKANDLANAEGIVKDLHVEFAAVRKILRSQFDRTT